MKRYNRTTIKEQKIEETIEPKIEEAVENPKTAELLSILKNEKFGNDEQRKKMIDVLTSLLTIKDKDARKVFKKVGDFFTDLGGEMLDEEPVKKVEEQVDIKKLKDTIKSEILAEILNSGAPTITAEKQKEYQVFDHTDLKGPLQNKTYLEELVQEQQKETVESLPEGIKEYTVKF